MHKLIVIGAFIVGIAALIAAVLTMTPVIPTQPTDTSPTATSTEEGVATSSIVTTYIDGNATGLNVTVNPREVVSDSRCPHDVQCIWAGTVEVRAAVSTQVAHGEHVFEINKPRVFGDFLITLVAVTPEPTAGEEIPDSSYRFTFKIEKQ